jgi:hypothetical protein
MTFIHLSEGNQSTEMEKQPPDFLQKEDRNMACMHIYVRSFARASTTSSDLTLNTDNEDILQPARHRQSRLHAISNAGLPIRTSPFQYPHSREINYQAEQLIPLRMAGIFPRGSLAVVRKAQDHGS